MGSDRSRHRSRPVRRYQLSAMEEDQDKRLAALEQKLDAALTMLETVLAEQSRMADEIEELRTSVDTI